MSVLLAADGIRASHVTAAVGCGGDAHWTSADHRELKLPFPSWLMFIGNYEILKLRMCVRFYSSSQMETLHVFDSGRTFTVLYSNSSVHFLKFLHNYSPFPFHIFPKMQPYVISRASKLMSHNLLHFIVTNNVRLKAELF